MPLCPQITLTPVTVTSSNMTVTSVIAGGVPATFEQLSEADAAAQQALADAAAAQADATTAIADAAAALAQASSAYDTAVIANTTANTALSTANGKNKVTYSTSTPGSTANTAGDIWFQYGTSGPNAGRIIAQYTGNGGTSWTQTTISGLVVANLDAGSITAGTLTVGIAITGPTNSFTVNAVTGVLTATGVNVTGTITATTGTFTGTVIATTGSFTGTVTATTGSFTGSVFSTNGTIGGWSIGSTAITKTVGTRTTTLNGSDGLITINDSSSGFLAGGALSISTPSVTTSISSSGMNIGSDAALDVRNELGGYSGILRIYAPSGKGIRLVPDAGLGSTTNNVSVEGNLNAIFTLSAGNFSSSSTTQTTGCYFSESGAVIGRRSNQIPFFAHRFSTTGTSEMIRLIYNGSDAGGITTTSGGVPAFRNASDYRLKSDIQDFIGAADLIKGTRLRSFKYNVDPDNTAVGFIAHELAEVLPGLVLGEKDAVDEEGNPAYQSITATDLIPYLTGALKDIILRVEALEGGR